MYCPVFLVNLGAKAMLPKQASDFADPASHVVDLYDGLTYPRP
jgi:hypothetical protein